MSDDDKKLTSDEAQKLVDEAVEKATEGLAAKNRELLDEVKKLKVKAKGSDIDPEEHITLQNTVEELTAKLEKSEKEHKAEVKKLTSRLDSESGFTRKLLVDNGLTDAATAAGVKSEFLPAVRAMLASKAEVVVEDGGNRIARIGDKSIKDYMAEWAQTDEGKHYIGAPGNSGGGAQGGKGGGPAPGNKKRSEMSFQDKANYIKEHGQEAYTKLPA